MPANHILCHILSSNCARLNIISYLAYSLCYIPSTAIGNRQYKPHTSISRRFFFSRREALQVGAAGIAGLGVGMTPAVAEARRKKKKEAGGDPPPKNPYGARPGGGISLPDYYKPWPAIKNRNLYAPGTEILPKNEMRISFLGSTPFPVSQEQSGTCMLVELGNGTAQPRRFFFDMGGGSARNMIALQVPIALVNDLFISHLHVDHYADLPLVYAFRAFLGGFTPFRVYGPSGRTPELGTKHMI